MIFHLLGIEAEILRMYSISGWVLVGLGLVGLGLVGIEMEISVCADSMEHLRC